MPNTMILAIKPITPSMAKTVARAGPLMVLIAVKLSLNDMAVQ